MARPLKILPDIAGVYGLVIFVSFVLFAGKRALGDGDTLWHIKFGDLILERGELITRDIFSHTAAGKPWTSHEWLAEVIMAAVHRVAGLPGVVIFYFLIAALSFWILFKIAQQCGAGEWLAIFSVSFALCLSLTHLLARPHIFTWLLGLITLHILLKGGRALFLLPLLMIPWTNLHGGFAIGLVLQGLFLVGSVLDKVLTASTRPALRAVWDEHKTLCLVLLLSLVATGINPFGYRLLMFPFEVSKGSFRTLISEWLAPSLQAYWYFRLYLLLLFSLLFFSGPRISWGNRLMLLFFVNASLMHSRHISIVGLFLTPLVVQGIKPYLEKRPLSRKRPPTGAELSLSPATGPLATIALGFVLISLGALHWGPWEKLSRVVIPPPEKFSSGVVEFLKESPPQGNLFNHDEWGDYLIYAMDPPPKLFLDGRLDMYGEEILEDYAKIVNIEEEVENTLEKHEIDWVLFPPSPFTRYLKAKGTWQEIYSDEQILVLIRRLPVRS
jgi:hypothetical protein